MSRGGVDNQLVMHYKLCMAYVTNLLRYRQERGLSQQEVADAALIHRNTYLDYESGERVPQLLVCRRIASALRCTVADLWPPFTDEELDEAS